MYRSAEKVPDHVAESSIYDFDVYDIGAVEGDFQGAMRRLLEPGVPPIFWTPRNGGHWVVTRGDDIHTVLNDPQRFSNRKLRVPAETAASTPMVPIQVDAPDHVRYRMMLMGAMSPPAVRELGQSARALAIRLIEGFQARGECEFVSEFAQDMPIAIFMQMVDLPLEDRPRLMDISVGFVRPERPEQREESFKALAAYCMAKVRERRERPGADLISELGAVRIDGELLDDQTLTGMLTLLMLAGLDTVASMLTFFVRFLAQHPAHRQQLIDDPSLIPNAVEELLRCHGIVNLGRQVAVDTEVSGVAMKQGEMVISPTSLENVDEARFKNALTVDFQRSRPRHATFGGGPHNCLGAKLARVELAIFLEEWLPRIPHFEIKAGEPIGLALGTTAVITNLQLVWSPQPAALAA